MLRQIQTQHKGGKVQKRECPECHSRKIWKSGIRKTRKGQIQRHKCKTCGRIFSESSSLSTNPNNKGDRQICVTLTEGTKNLTKVEPYNDGLAGATPEPATINGLIIQFLWFLRKQNYAEITTINYVKDIKLLIKRGAQITHPEHTKMVMAKQKWSDIRRVKVYYAYDAFVKMLGKSWDMPRIRIQKKLGFCPTEKTVNQAIAGFGKKVSIKIQLIAETGMRSGEADNLTWNQINFNTATITVIPEKGSNPTVKQVSRELLARIQSLPNTSEKIFGEINKNTMITNLEQQRKSLARKLGNPELLRLTYLTVRHYYGTKLYHRGKPLLEIMVIMGHKEYTSTLQYINYDKIIFGDNNEWICKIAETHEDRKSLIEAGFQFVEQVNNKSFYRKQK